MATQFVKFVTRTARTLEESTGLHKDSHYKQAVFELQIRDKTGQYHSINTSLLDTGTGFTTVPKDFLDENNIHYSTDRVIKIGGATGSANGYLHRLTIRLAGIPDFTFSTLCIVNPYLKKDRALFGLNDLTARFHIAEAMDRHRTPGFLLTLLPTNWWARQWQKLVDIYRILASRR